jgi:hypothetical protein
MQSQLTSITQQEDIAPFSVLRKKLAAMNMLQEHLLIKDHMLLIFILTY